MPSFDVVSEINLHEAANAVDQASREVATRFDFKGVDARFEREEGVITLHAEAEFQLKQMQDMLLPKLAKRGIDIKCAKIDEPILSGSKARQVITLRQGIDQALAKKITGLIKDSKLKVQSAIQGEKIRITGKKKDDLQLVIALLRKADLELPLQFENFRD